MASRSSNLVRQILFEIKIKDNNLKERIISLIILKSKFKKQIQNSSIYKKKENKKTLITVML